MTEHQKRQRHTRAVIRDVQIKLWLYVLVYWFLRHYSSVGNVSRVKSCQRGANGCGDGNDQPDFKGHGHASTAMKGAWHVLCYHVTQFLQLSCLAKFPHNLLFVFLRRTQGFNKATVGTCKADFYSEEYSYEITCKAFLYRIECVRVPSLNPSQDFLRPHVL